MYFLMTTKTISKTIAEGVRIWMFLVLYYEVVQLCKFILFYDTQYHCDFAKIGTPQAKNKKAFRNNLFES